MNASPSSNVARVDQQRYGMALAATNVNVSEGKKGGGSFSFRRVCACRSCTYACHGSNSDEHDGVKCHKD